MFFKHQIERIESRLNEVHSQLNESSDNQHIKCIHNVSIAIQELKATLYTSKPDLLEFIKICSNLQIKLSKIRCTLKLLFIASNLTSTFDTEDTEDNKQDCEFLNTAITLFTFTSIPREFHLLVVQQIDIFYDSKAYEWLDKIMILQLMHDLKVLYELDFTFLSYFHQVEESSLNFTNDIHQSNRTRIVLANSSTHGSIAVTYHNIPIVDHAFTSLVKRVEIIRKLSHPSLIQIFQVSYSDFDPIPFYTSISCSHFDANSFLSRIEPSDNVMEFRIMNDVALGLKHLHSFNISHGKIQASHIYIQTDGSAQLGNFGISNYFEDHYPWMSPERLSKDEFQFSKEDDIYAFAITCGELFSKAEPYFQLGLRNKEQLVRHVMNGGRPDLDFQPHLPMILWNAGLTQWWNQDLEQRGDIDSVISCLNSVLNLIYYSNYDSFIPFESIDTSSPLNSISELDEHSIIKVDDVDQESNRSKRSDSISDVENNWDIRRSHTLYTKRIPETSNESKQQMKESAPQKIFGRTLTIKPREDTTLNIQVPELDKRLSQYFDPLCISSETTSKMSLSSGLDTARIKDLRDQFGGGNNSIKVASDTQQSSLASIDDKGEKPLIIYMMEEMTANERTFYEDIHNFRTFFQPDLLKMTSKRSVACIFDVLDRLEDLSGHVYGDLTRLMTKCWTQKPPQEPLEETKHKILNEICAIFAKYGGQFELYAHYAIGHILRVNEYQKIAKMSSYQTLLKKLKIELRSMDLQHLITSPIQHITRYAHLRLPRLLQQVDSTSEIHSRLKKVSDFITEISYTVEKMQKQVENLNISMRLHTIRNCPNLIRGYNRILIDHYTAKHGGDDWKVYLFTDILILVGGNPETVMYHIDIENLKIPKKIESSAARKMCYISITVLNDSKTFIKLELTTPDADKLIKGIRKFKSNDVCYSLPNQLISQFDCDQIYKAQNEFQSRAISELFVQKGDDITLIKKYDKSGWAVGMSSKSKKNGAFPLACLVIPDTLNPFAVEEISIEVYKTTAVSPQYDFQTDHITLTLTDTFYILEFDVTMFMAYVRKIDDKQTEGWLPIENIKGFFKVTNTKYIQDLRFRPAKVHKNDMVYIDKIYHSERAKGRIGPENVNITSMNSITANLYSGPKKFDKKRNSFEVSSISSKRSLK